MRRSLAMLCLLMLVASSPVRAEKPETRPWRATMVPPPVAGLADLLPDALDDNPALKSALSAHNAARLDLVNGVVAFGPRANWTFDNSRERLDVVRTQNYIYQRGVSHFGNYDNTLQVVQPLFDARLFAQLHGDYAALRQTRAEAVSARQKAIFDLAQAYLTVLGSADALALSVSEEATLTRQNEMMQVRIAHGLGSGADADEVDARLLQARAQREAARVALDEAFATLDHRAGRRVEAIWPLTGPFPMPRPDPASVEDWVTAARSQNPDVMAAMDAAISAKSTFESQLGAMLPRVELDFSQNRSESGGSVYGGGDFTTDRTVLFRVTIPLFNGDGTGYPAAAAHARYNAAKYRVEDERRDVADHVHTAFDEVIGNAAREKSLVLGAQAQSRVLQSRQEKFQAGLLQIVDLLDADRDFIQIQRQLLATRYNYLLNLFQLKRLAGDVTEADAAFVDSFLQRGADAVRRPADNPP